MKKIIILGLFLWVGWYALTTYNSAKKFNTAYGSSKQLGKLYKENPQLVSKLIKRNTPECLDKYTNVETFQTGVSDYYADLIIFSIDNAINNPNKSTEEFSVDGEKYINKMEKDLALAYGSEYVRFLQKNISFMHTLDLPQHHIITILSYYECLATS